MNGYYNSVRGLAQNFIDGRDLSLNITRFKSRFTDDPRGFSASKSNTAFGLEGFIAGGAYKRIEVTRPNLKALCKELRRDPVGLMVAQPRIVESLLQFADADFFKEVGVATWISLGERPLAWIRDALSSVGIEVTANYSCEEIGMIGHECRTTPDFYHVCNSNVLVEIERNALADLDGQPAGPVLLTHLHSYATPFIRYDVGDIASLHKSCPCGYQGPVLSNIYGRSKQLLKHPDGRVSPFLIRAAEIIAIADIAEFRIRQTALQTIIAEIGAAETLPPAKIDAFRQLLQTYAGEGFDIQVNQVPKIDWGRDTKRLGFRNELLN